jgi:alpha-beta hydrolase superfamily lysophospholipase
MRLPALAALCASLALIPALTLAQDQICDSECQKGCDTTCQATIQSKYETEREHWVGDVATDPFYATPANFSASKPGDILRWEDLSSSQLSKNWTIPASLSLSRFLYASEDANGSAVPASAFVLLPFAVPPANTDGTLDTVVWAHGTAGTARQCAPTNYKTLFVEWQAPFFLAELGYAVVAPDYAAQGSAAPAAALYAAGALHALDAVHALAAARARLGDLLSRSWALYGHSEGGMTAWRANERLALNESKPLRRAAGKLVGVVAAAPALKPQRLIADNLAVRAKDGKPTKNPYAIFLLQELARLYPSAIRLADYLAPTAAQRLGVLAKGCSRVNMAAVGNLTTAEMFKNTSFLDSPVLADWAVRYSGQNGPRAFAAPMLVLQGEADEIIAPASVLAEVNATCTALPESKLHVRLYPDMGHGEIVEAAKGEIVAWLAARFAGGNVVSRCRTNTVKPITDHYGKKRVTWVGVVDSD